MIEELLGKLRGVDRWPETTATVLSADRVPPAGLSLATATIVFNYRSTDGQLRSGKFFFIGDQSSLYNLDQDDTFPIRFNPAHPERYFSDEYAIAFGWKLCAVMIGGFALVFLYSLLKPL